MSTPNTQIFICNVPLTNAYEHTYYFETPADQIDFFDRRIIHRFGDHTIVRKTGNVRVQAAFETARSWSYLFVSQPVGGSMVRRYYFVTDVEYINDATVELHLELDVMQTYMFSTSLTECFVEREHTANDTIDRDFVDEGLDTGEMVTISKTNVALGDMCIMVASTMQLAGIPAEDMTAIEMPATGAMIDGVYNGVQFFAVDPTQANIAKLNIAISRLDAGGKSDCIIAMWMFPKNLVTLSNMDSWGDGDYPFKAVTGCQGFDVTFSRPKSLGYRSMYTPRNKKLLAYPYSTLYVTNNAGAAAPYHYELFAVPEACAFRIVGALGPDGTCRIYPVNYAGALLNYEAGVSLGSFPMCGWNQDLYTLWVAQNQGQLTASYAGALATTAAGVVTTVSSGGVAAAAGAGMIWGGLQQIGGLLAQQHDRAIQPPQAKGQASASVNVAAEHMTFTVMRKTITERVAASLDDYFDMYGYKTLRVKVPHKNHRASWWYTKTVGCNVVGSAPTADRVKIASIYDKGVTFWRAADQLGNYALSNSII